jgi:hypothetical protein
MVVEHVTHNLKNRRFESYYWQWERQNQKSTLMQKHGGRIRDS